MTRDNQGRQQEATEQRHILKVCERWYILLVFGFIAFAQAFIWNTYGPITDVVQNVFQWNDAMIAMLNNWGPIFFIIFVVPFAIFVDRFGLRYGVLASAGFVLGGAACRCFYFPTNDTANTIIQNVAAILNAIGGPIFWGAPTIVSALWFPAEQRTLATSIAVLLSTFGNSLAFVVEPAIVRNYFPRNDTEFRNSSEFSSAKQSAVDQLFTMFYVTCGFTAFLTVCALAYYPARPRSAPSTSANERREPFSVGVRQLARSPSFWYLMTSYSIATGIMFSWISIIYIVLRPLGTHTELEAGFLGFITNIVQSLLGLAFAKVADSHIRQTKRLLIGVLLLSIVIFAIFGLMAVGVIPLHRLILDICIVTAVSFVSALMPVYLELTNEVCYPVSESLCSLAVSFGNQVISVAFYFSVSAINVSMNNDSSGVLSQWLFWIPLVSVVVGLIPLLFLREQFNRIKLDVKVNGEEPSTPATEQNQLLHNNNQTVFQDALNADDIPLTLTAEIDKPDNKVESV